MPGGPTATDKTSDGLGKALNAMELAAGGAQNVGAGVADIAENGVSVGNVTQIAFGLLEIFTSFKNCFPAGTPVSTETGQKPIETIQAGDRVWAYSLSAGEWRLRPVMETYQFVNDEFVRIEAAGEPITSTAGHPFWVVRGADLEDRPRPEHIQAAEQELRERNSAIPGRWVDAGDLQVGDLLFLRDGRQVRVDSVELFQERQLTYNFAVDDLHCYAVGDLSVLVHNGCGDSAKLRKNLGLTKGDGLEAHHIVPSGHRRAQAARDILAANGIDINDAINGVPLKPSAHRGVGLHSYSSIDAVTRRLRVGMGALASGSPEAASQILNVLAQLKSEIAGGLIPGMF